MLCVGCARGWPSWAAFQFFEVVALWFLGVVLIFFLMHLFKFHAKMGCINWPLTVSISNRLWPLAAAEVCRSPTPPAVWGGAWGEPQPPNAATGSVALGLLVLEQMLESRLQLCCGIGLEWVGL